ncbi:MAG: prepilin-type N-terminal cleavage/methylation domain-containing protein [Alphaproteobacteria bacterium]|nr:prepilin-type N-terminal cleavage/methylation domain-containing protein [Alphaproteobacteria bacterium]
MKQRKDHGYSLVELLVVLALLGFISIAVAGGVRFGSRAWEKSGANVDLIERMDGAQTLLRTLLQRVVPRELDPNFSIDPNLFAGAPDSLSFTAGAPSAFGSNGNAHFQLRVIRDANLQSLSLSWRSANATAPAQQQRLIAGARTITFAYATRDQAGRMAWTDTWTGQSGAPALVMIRATFPEGSQMRWPELIVRPRVARDPSCIYDPVAFSCRHA